jgi:hypothetical protein
MMTDENGRKLFLSTHSEIGGRRGCWSVAAAVVAVVILAVSIPWWLPR